MAKSSRLATHLTVAAIACGLVAVAAVLFNDGPSGDAVGHDVPETRVVTVANRCGDVALDTSGNPVVISLELQPPPDAALPEQDGAYNRLPAPPTEEPLVAAVLPAYVSSQVDCGPPE